jgi:hypothetical protein
MIFGAPWMLAALPLVAAPVIIHLLQRRRFRRVPFAAMQFLRRAMKRMRRRVLLEDVLLLALRTLAVLAAILALARPSADRPPGWLAAAARSEIVILDASLSMNHRSGGQTTFERATMLAERMFTAAAPERGARAALILAGQRAERLAAGEPAAALAALEPLAAAGHGRADLDGALAIALRTAEDFLLDAPPRVTVLTDLQAHAWDLAADGTAAWARLAQAGVTVEVVDAGARQRDNVAVTALTLPSRRLVLGDAADATATIRNFGGATAEVRAEALLDGDPIANAVLTLAAGEQSEWTFAVDPRLPGARALEVRLAHDALIEDDARAAAFELSEALEMVVVGEPALRERTPGVCDALLAYFDLGEGSPLRALQIAPAALDARALSAADLLVLADPGPLTPRAGEAAAAFLARGGGMLIALGPRTAPEHLAEFVRAAGLGAIALEETRTASDPFGRLRIEDEAYPAVQFFTDPRWLPLLTEVPFREWRPLRVDDATRARAVLSFSRAEGAAGEGYALVEERAGPGRVAWLSAAPCASWNRMEEVPGGTLALLYDLAFHLAPATILAVDSEVGQPLSALLPSPPAELVLRDPDGARFPITPALQPEAGGARTRAMLLPAADRPGIWSATALLLEEDGSDRRVELRLAVGVPPVESDLRAADADALRPLLPEGVTLRRFDEAAAAPAEDAGGATEFTRLLWQAVVILFLSETLLAAFLDRRRR